MGSGQTRQRLLIGLAAIGVGSCIPASRRPGGTQETATPHPVIPPGKQDEVVGLLGPLAGGGADSAWKLERTTVAAERIDYVFAGPEGRVVITLAALAARDDAGAAHATTRSFRISVEGTAPVEAQRRIADRLTAEVRSRDRGQLWINSRDAPRTDGGPP